MEAGKTCSDISWVGKRGEFSLERDLGVFTLNQELSKLHDYFQKKKNYFDRIEGELNNLRKPLLFFEGQQDTTHFQLAHKSLYNEDISDRFQLGMHEISEGSSIGDGALNLNRLMYEYIGKFPLSESVIGIFDYDIEGFNQLKGLLKKGSYKSLSALYKYDHIYVKLNAPKVFVMLLAPPDHRKNFYHKRDSQYCYVSTELLYKNEEIPTANRAYPTLYDKTVFSFRGDKARFLEKIQQKVKDRNNVDFSGFKKTFDLINKIITD